MAEKLNREQVEAQNRRAAELNTKRNQMIGQQQSAQTQLKRMADAYKAKYGVELTPQTLQAEYNEQSELLHAQYREQAELIAAVESGSYKQASTPALVTPEPVSLAGTAPGAGNAVGGVTGRVQAAVPNQSATPSAGYDEEGLGLAAGVSGQGFVGVPSIPTGDEDGVDANDPSEQPFTPTGWSL